MDATHPRGSVASLASAGRRLRRIGRRFLPTLPQAPLDAMQPLGFLVAPMRSIMLSNLALWRIAKEVNLSRFCAAPLITYCAAKEMNHGHSQDG
jgi:hypothetical protein